jgi:predicted nucleotidyltransferase
MKHNNQIEQIVSKLRETMPILTEKYRVKALQAFGSYTRGQQKKESDVDILVEFHETIDLFTFVELEDFLSEVLGIKVDLVMKDTLKPRIKEKILREAIPI